MRLIVANLRCVRGGREIFAGLDFELNAGESLLIKGPNGAGKSSLLRLVAGLLRPADGRIALEGGEADRALPELAHYLGHLDPLKSALTVAENLDFWAAFLGQGTPRDGRRPRHGGFGRAGGAAGSLSFRRPAPAPVDRPAVGGPTAGLAARRADLGPRRGRPGNRERVLLGHARKPASMRSTPARSSAVAISSFSPGESTTPTVCSPSRSVVS